MVVMVRKRKVIKPKRKPFRKYSYAPISTIRNTNLNSSDKKVVVRRGIKLPQFLKTYMETFTPREMENMRARRTEISSDYTVHFNKSTLKIDSTGLDEATKNVIEYAVRANIGSLPVYQRKFLKQNWNGSLFMKIKKLVKPLRNNTQNAYTIPWHRDSLSMEIMGRKVKAFLVGAIYVKRPENITGGEIQFARNSMRYGLAPPSGTSVTFFDEDVFHKVTPIRAPEGLEYVPRSALFFAYLSDPSTRRFKKGLVEGRSGGITNRNYEKFYRNGIPTWMKKVFNGVSLNNSNLQQAARLVGRNTITPGNIRSIINQQSKVFFENNTANYNNLKTLHNNLKRSFHTNVVPIHSKSFILSVKPQKRYPLAKPIVIKKLRNVKKLGNRFDRFMSNVSNYTSSSRNIENLRSKFSNYNRLKRMKNAVSKPNISLNKLRANGFSGTEASVILKRFATLNSLYR